MIDDPVHILDSNLLHDNTALERAFFHQSQYFRWAFIQVVIPAAATILGSLL